MADEMPKPPETASCWIPLGVLAAVAILFVIALPISRTLVGDPIRMAEKGAVKAAELYVDRESLPGSMFDQMVGKVDSKRVVKIGIEKGPPAKVFVTLDLKGDKGAGVATLALVKEGGDYRVVDSAVDRR
ncbi:MAG: hypothetical protein JNM28_04255 [Armatimonadetes bacterium]|nr:hypothetical protein [Armatimonadota bacterium]